ncbi:hypothetical protein N1027_00140 [Herbiconiux sp. CPCC 205763]|uniref:Uncharacterized protein n=1 Tax=Herbiconiux aconitum TaxID=2970913 RepID=A0ABT2GK08_9MICO|nr:hypothetical protein [Herbiconiux aconitum]MCS5716542.1 hypothetical protein [Herbiconiux aconitum]
MIGWRRRAKAARESTVSQERQYELVSQTLMENFGPLGSFAITRRSASDTDDIFHTALAKSVAHDIVANLAEHGISMKSNGHGIIAPLTPVESVPVPRQLARAVASATGRAPVAPAAAVVALAPVAPLIPAYPTVAAGVAIGAAPMIDGPDPRDDDALRSLVAHHNAVTEAVAQRQMETRTIAI